VAPPCSSAGDDCFFLESVMSGPCFLNLSSDQGQSRANLPQGVRIVRSVNGKGTDMTHFYGVVRSQRFASLRLELRERKRGAAGASNCADSKE